MLVFYILFNTQGHIGAGHQWEWNPHRRDSDKTPHWLLTRPFWTSWGESGEGTSYKFKLPHAKLNVKVRVFRSHSTARHILGQVFRISTCESATHTEGNPHLLTTRPMWTSRRQYEWTKYIL